MIPLRISVLDGDILSYYVVTLAQRLGTGGGISCTAPLDTLSDGLSSAAAPALEREEPEHQAASTPSASFLHAHLVLEAIRHAALAKRIFVATEADSSRGKANFDVELN